jgi:cell division protein FtsI (penicillin-binding protein 3)
VVAALSMDLRKVNANTIVDTSPGTYRIGPP